MAASSLPIADALQADLRTRTFGRSLRCYRSIASTNTEAAAWAQAGAPEGATVYAAFQEAGRGRLGRSWEGQPGRNLMFSVVLRPEIPPDVWGLITLAASVAVAEVLVPLAAPVGVQIKWPNDVLLDGRKCCGMLLESAWGRARRPTGAAVILGVGLNVNQDAFAAPGATSLLLATGRHVPRAPLWASLLMALETWYGRVQRGETDVVQAAYEDRLLGRGDRITLRAAGGDETISGVLHGVDARGALRLGTATGIRTYHAGDVTVALPRS